MSRETNVRVPECALNRLNELTTVLGLSRDATVRQLVGEFIERQEDLAEDDRLTHISTVMRHPLPRLLKTQPPVGTPLRLRLPEGTAQRARELAFHVPGQARSRGHRDYQSRLLTDAVMTSIAIGCTAQGLEPITDEVLGGLHPLLRHRAARGLWWLAVSVTQSGAENDVFLEAARDRKAREQEAARTGSTPAPATHIEQVAVLLRGTEAPRIGTKAAGWHHRHRNRIVQRLAAEFLGGDDGRRVRMENRLYDQHEDHRWGEGEEWDDLLDDAKRVVSGWRLWSEADGHDAPGPGPSLEVPVEGGRRERSRKSNDLTRQLPGLEVDRTDPKAPVFVLGSLNIEGRGGGAVWRAERILAVNDIPSWLAESARSTAPESRTHLVPLPGWRLVSPESWEPYFLPTLPDVWAAHVDAGRVLKFTSGNTSFLWPTVWDDHREENVPVQGVDLVIAAIGEQKSQNEIAEILLMQLIPGTADEAKQWGGHTADLAAEIGDATSSSCHDDPFGLSARDDPFAVPPSSEDHESTSADTAPEEDDFSLLVDFPGDVPPLSTLKFRWTEGDIIDDDPKSDPHIGSATPMFAGTGDAMQTVLVPAGLAEEFGFIDIARRDQLLAEAKKETERRMRVALGRVPSKHWHRKGELEAAMSDPTQFSALASTVEVKFHQCRAVWCWPVTSLADEVAFGRPPRILTWLADYLCQSHTRELERAMEDAYREAMHQYAYLYE